MGAPTPFSIAFKKQLSEIPVGKKFTTQTFAPLIEKYGSTTANIVASLYYQQKAGLIARVGSEPNITIDKGGRHRKNDWAVYVRVETKKAGKLLGKVWKTEKVKDGVFGDLFMTPQPASRPRGKVHILR